MDAGLNGLLGPKAVEQELSPEQDPAQTLLQHTMVETARERISRSENAARSHLRVKKICTTS